MKTPKPEFIIVRLTKPKKSISTTVLYVLLGMMPIKKKIWTQKEMDADHVLAWSKGGATDESNCQMLCKTHNRAKGNR